LQIIIIILYPAIIVTERKKFINEFFEMYNFVIEINFERWYRILSLSILVIWSKFC